MIKTLTSWRGIFALCIVCFHFAMHEFDQMAFAGVTFFFIISGFLVALLHESLGSTKQYYLRRVWRIFPLHWLALIAMIALDLVMIHKFHYGWDLSLHVALLQSWVPNVDVYYNYSIHSWFLSSLLFAIIATPLLLRFINTTNRKVTWAIVITACLAVTVLYLLASEKLFSFYHVFPPMRLVDYTLGMMLGATMRTPLKTQHVSTAGASAIEVAALLVFAAFIALHASGNQLALRLGNAPLWWIPVALLIVTFTALDGNEGIVGKLLTIRPLVWLGEISFEIYILQKLVNNIFCYLVAPFFGHYGIMIYDYSFACTLPLLIIIAWAAHQLTKTIKHN